MSETPMNKLGELCGKWERAYDSRAGGSIVNQAKAACASELRAILPDVERLVEALRLACNFLPVGSEACLYCDNLGEEHAPNCVTVVIRSALALFAHPVAPKEKK